LVVPDNHPLQPLLCSRKTALTLLGFKSISSLRELEEQHKLTAVRPTGKPRGEVFYPYAELLALANPAATPTTAVTPESIPRLERWRSPSRRR
jgi:hypothetical protein